MAVTVDAKTPAQLVAFSDTTTIERNADVGMVFDDNLLELKRLVIGHLLDWRVVVSQASNLALSKPTHQNALVLGTAANVILTLWTSPVLGDRVLVGQNASNLVIVRPPSGLALGWGTINKGMVLYTTGHVVFTCVIANTWFIERESCEWNFET